MAYNIKFVTIFIAFMVLLVSLASNPIRNLLFSLKIHFHTKVLLVGG